MVSGGQGLAATGRESELIGGLGSVQGPSAETFKHLADEGGRGTMDALLMLFKDAQCNQEHSCFENYKTSPVWLAPRQFFIQFKGRLKDRFQQLDIWLTTHPIEAL